MMTDTTTLVRCRVGKIRATMIAALRLEGQTLATMMVDGHAAKQIPTMTTVIHLLDDGGTETHTMTMSLHLDDKGASSTAPNLSQR